MNFLGNCLLLMALIITVSSQNIQELVEECKATVPMSEELEKAYLNLEFPPGETTECFTNCIGRRLNILDDNSVINAVVVNELLQEFNPGAEDIMADENRQSCLINAGVPMEEEGADPCGKAYEVFQCFLEDFVELMRNRN